MGVQNPNERPVKAKPKARVKFLPPKPEVTRPVTPKQKQAINRGVVKAQRQQAVKTALGTAKKASGHLLSRSGEGTGVFGPQLKRGKGGKLRVEHGVATRGHLAYTGGDPLTGLNQVFHLAAGGAGKLLSGSPEIVRNAAKEALDSPSQAIPATVMAVTHPKMVVKQIVETAKHPGKSFVEHPITTLLLARGGVAGVGRGAGAVLRAAPKGSAIHALADTTRADLKLPHGVKQQRYSKDVTVKAVQKAGEKSKTVTNLRAGHEANRQMDRTIGANEGERRMVRDLTRTTVTKLKPRHHDAVALVNEGVLKHPSTAKADLEAELGRLHTEAKRKLEPVDRRANSDNIAATEKLLADKHFLADPHPAFEAARVYSRSQKPVTMARVRYQDLEAAQAARRPLLPFAVREMGLKWDKGAQAFRDASGNAVSDRAILREFKAKGGDARNLAYVPERASFKGARNFYINTSKRPAAETRTFKGKNTAGGLYQRDFNVLVEQAVRSAGSVSAHRGVDRLVNDYGRVKPGGKFFTGAEARHEADQIAEATGEKWVPLRVLRGQDRVREGLAPQDMPRMFSEHVSEKDGTVALFPAKLAKRILDHEQVTRNPLARDFQAINQRFRHVVLPTSSRWFTGNITEMLLRTAVEDPTFLKSVTTGVQLERVVKELGGQEAVNRLRSSAGAGHFGAQAKFDVHREPQNKITATLHAFRRTPGPKQVADTWELYKKLVFGANTRAESLIYYAGLGKEASREVHDFTGAWHKTLNLGGPAYRDVAKGLLDTPNIHRYAQAIDDMRGKYSNLSPLFRALTTTVTPFAPWYVNALHFIYYTLPFKHPIKTALLGQTVASQQKKLEALGITHFPTNGQAPMPAFLLGRIPVKGGGLLPAAQYTPFGATTDIGGNAASLFAPQFSSVIQNLSGQSFTGKNLKDAQGHDIPAGDPRTFGVALNTLAESFVPFLRHARQIREKGGGPTDTSTVFSPQTKKYAPGKSTGEGIKRAFNPFYISGNKGKVRVGGGINSGPSAADILGSSSGPSVADILGQQP